MAEDPKTCNVCGEVYGQCDHTRLTRVQPLRAGQTDWPVGEGAHRALEDGFESLLVPEIQIGPFPEIDLSELYNLNYDVLDRTDAMEKEMEIESTNKIYATLVQWILWGHVQTIHRLMEIGLTGSLQNFSHLDRKELDQVSVHLDSVGSGTPTCMPEGMRIFLTFHRWSRPPERFLAFYGRCPFCNGTGHISSRLGPNGGDGFSFAPCNDCQTLGIDPVYLSKKE